MSRRIFTLKKFVTLMLTVVTLMSAMTFQAVQADENYNGGYGFAYTDLTVSGSIGGSKIGTIYRYEGFTILNTSGDWYYVEYSTSSGAKRGYVYKSGSNLTLEEYTCVGKVTSSASIYYGPDTSAYQRAGSVSTGELVALLAKNGDWAYVEYNTTSGRKRGYMLFSQLYLYNRPQLFKNLYTYGGNGENVYYSGTYTVYSGPSKQYTTVGSISNETIKVLYILNNGGIKGYNIEYNANGQKKSGFIFTSYS